MAEIIRRSKSGDTSFKTWEGGNYASVYRGKFGGSHTSIRFTTYKGYEIWRNKQTDSRGHIIFKFYWISEEKTGGRVGRANYKTVADAKKAIDKTRAAKIRRSPNKKEMQRRKVKAIRKSKGKLRLE